MRGTRCINIAPNVLYVVENSVSNIDVTQCYTEKGFRELCPRGPKYLII